MRGIVSLAYASNRSPPRYRRRAEESSIPGPLFDVCVIAVFLIFLVGYLA